MSERYRSQEQWNELATTAAGALARLHNAIASYADWVGVVRPGAELREQLDIVKQNGVMLSSPVVDRTLCAALALDEIGEIRSSFQHGDFCFNNMLIEDSRVGIVDFEEFGQTAVPLQDEIGLCFSVRTLAPKTVAWRAIATPILCGAAQRLNVTRDQLSGLVLHYLLWRINRCHNWPTRSAAKMELLTQVEEDHDWLPPLGAKSFSRNA
jgi:aminoglycoside phosphotransferase (APT) family kinase protein